MKIDLTTERGNAAELIAVCVGAAHQLDMPSDQVATLVRRMTAGNYENLLSVMDQAFPFCFEFINDPRRPQDTA